MSVKKILIGATSLVAIAAFAPAAHAQGAATTEFGGGGTLASKLYRDIFNCYGGTAFGIFANSPGSVGVTYPTGQNAACPTQADAGESLAYEPVGSGAGQAAFTSGNPTSFGTPSSSNSVAYINTNIGANSTPYPEVEYAGSDAYLTTAQLTTAQTVDNNSPVFVIPTVATPITLPIGQVNGVQLTIGNVCKIFSGQQKVKGNKNATQQIYVRADGSGTSFIFTEFLANNCPVAGGYKFTAGNGFPSTSPNWAAAQVGTVATITAVTGSGGIANAVAAAKDSIGYVSPDFVQPIVNISAYPAEVGKTPTTTFKPSVANVQAHVAAITIPTTYNNALGQKLNDALASTKANGSGYPIVGFTFVYTYGCYSSSFDGGKIGTKAKGTALKAAFTAVIANSGATPTTLQNEVNAIVTNAGFSPVTYSTNQKIAALLYSAKGPLNAAAGINGTTGTCKASRPN